MSKLRLVNGDEFEESDLKVFLDLKNFGKIYVVLSVCDKGIDICFLKIIVARIPASHFTEETTAKIPKIVFRTHAHSRWFDKFFGITIESKVKRILNRWKRRLTEFDEVLASTGSNHSTAVMEI